MKFPVLHLNGSGYENLSEQLRDALSALREAKSALARAAPHERDYYVDGPDAGHLARIEHNARERKLDEVQQELTVILENVFEQHMEREDFRAPKAPTE